MRYTFHEIRATDTLLIRDFDAQTLADADVQVMQDLVKSFRSSSDVTIDAHIKPTTIRYKVTALMGKITIPPTYELKEQG